MILRPYQIELISDAREAMRHDRRVLLQAPTGAGKTAITVNMMAAAVERDMRAWFLVHQNELLTQTSRALWKQKLEHGFIASGKATTPCAAQVASVQTLVRRLDHLQPPNLIIIDEAHRAAAATYAKVLEAFPNAYVIGLTATPARTDGQGLGGMFDALVQGPTIAQLIEAGYLCDYEIMAPPQVADVSNVKTTAGDYNAGELAEAMDRPTITGDAVAHYVEHASGKRCVVMCVTLKHAQHVQQQYESAGVAAEFLHGGLTDKERELMLARFEAGETHVLTNCQLMIEGIDVPMIEVVQWLRPTQSLIIWMQGNGRGLRPADGKDHLLILDHVGNWQKHGLPDEDREWSLESRKRRKRGARDDENLNVSQCRACYHVFKSGPTTCPKCGAPVAAPVREIQQVDGELKKLEAAQQRREQRQEQGTARSLSELVQLGVRRKLKHPTGWAANIYASREGRKPTPMDYKLAKEALIEVKHDTAF